MRTVCRNARLLIESNLISDLNRTKFPRFFHSYSITWQNDSKLRIVFVAKQVSEQPTRRKTWILVGNSIGKMVQSASDKVVQGSEIVFAKILVVVVVEMFKKRRAARREEGKDRWKGLAFIKIAGNTPWPGEERTVWFTKQKETTDGSSWHQAPGPTALTLPKTGSRHLATPLLLGPSPHPPSTSPPLPFGYHQRILNTLARNTRNRPRKRRCIVTGRVS